MSRSGKEGTNNNWHERAADTALHALKTTANGLSQTEAATRLETHGPNRLPEAAKRSALLRFLLHFHNVFDLRAFGLRRHHDDVGSSCRYVGHCSGGFYQQNNFAVQTALLHKTWCAPVSKGATLTIASIVSV